MMVMWFNSVVCHLFYLYARLWAGNQYHVRSRHAEVAIFSGCNPHSHQWLHRQNSRLDPQQPVLTGRHCTGTGCTTGRTVHTVTTLTQLLNSSWTFCHVFCFAAGWHVFVSDSDKTDQRPDRAAELQPATQLWPVELIRERPKFDEQNKKHLRPQLSGDWLVELFTSVQQSCGCFERVMTLEEKAQRAKRWFLKSLLKYQVQKMYLVCMLNFSGEPESRLSMSSMFFVLLCVTLGQNSYSAFFKLYS